MKKNLMILFSVLFITAGIIIAGCSSESPSGPQTPQNTATVTATMTITATPTKTPDYGTLSGSIELPAGQGQPGSVWQVIVDTDKNFANDIECTINGVCGASVSIPYSVTLPAGTYYVYAIVKVQSSLTQPPVQGDYLGIYGNTYPDTPASANVAITVNNTASNIDIDMTLASDNVSGTLTMPASADGKNIIIFLDDDGDTGNGGISYYQITQISGMGGGTTYSYTALCVFTGSYYITALVDNDGSGLPGAPTAGDYGGLSIQHGMTEDAANGPFNFTLSAL